MTNPSQVGQNQSESLTRQKVARLLGADSFNPFVPSEEQRHPWSVDRSQELDGPLMRIWDKNSGSQPLEDGRMLSRSPNRSLNTKEARRESLAIQINYGNWIPTPYISFTNSTDVIERYADMRSRRQRGDQTLTVINPSTRLRLGRPILYMPTEMDHYDISDPYDNEGEYYTNEYVCLWEITREEIIHHHDWKELSEKSNWYNNVIMPAFTRSNRERQPSLDTTPTSAFDMSEIKETLPNEFLANARSSDHPDLEWLEDSEESFEHDDAAYDDDTDSDDEAEEANRNDDIIKIIEGL